MKHIRPGIRLGLFGLAVLLLGFAGASATRAAQTDPGEGLEPVNLSESGGTANPMLVADSDGLIHLLWRDTFADYVYMSYGEEGWTEPVEFALPLDPEDDLLLKLVGNLESQIHAFWTDEDDDLLYSRAPASGLTNPSNWSRALNLASTIIAVDALVDAEGIVHLAYIRVEDTEALPSGVYYTRSQNNGASWVSPALVYESPYLRFLEPENANISLMTSTDGEITKVHLAWDNPLIERVFTATSSDLGETWAETVEVDGPDDLQAGQLPYGLKLAMADDQLMLFWQVGEPNTKCVPYYQISDDGGGSWQEPLIIRGMNDLIGCFEYVQFKQVQPSLTLAAFKLREFIYFMAWNGAEWSEPQLQSEISNFIDPITLNPVELDCLQSVLAPSGILVVMGCETGPEGDIWNWNRLIDNTIDWYAPPPVWNLPMLVASSSFEITSPVLLTDLEGRMHAIWSQPLESADRPGKTAIYYARHENGAWSPAKVVLESASGNADEPEGALDAENRIHIVWSGGENGAIQYSWADASLAVAASEWSEPVELPAPRPVGSKPDIFIGADGRIFVVYSIPLNEQRGVYVTTSIDRGATWSEAVQVFDGASANWEMIDEPRISGTDDGNLVLTFIQSSLPGGEGPSLLAYARSAGEGSNWSGWRPAVTEPVFWNDLLTTKDQYIHLIWEQSILGRVGFRNRVTLDRAQTWSDSVSISGVVNAGPASAIVDPAGQVHLVQFSEVTGSSLALNHWTWIGWERFSQEVTDLGFEGISASNAIAVGITPENRLGVLFSGRQLIEPNTEPTINLYFTSRPLQLSDEFSVEIPTATPAVVIAPTRVVDPTATPTPTPAIPPLEREQGGLLSSVINLTDPWLGLFTGLAASGLIVIVLFFTSILIKRMRGRS